MTEPVPPGPRSGWVSIFRRIAVERYSQATPADVPEMLAPLSRLLILAGIALLCLAAALFRIP